ncbi:hypothetical protein FKW77_007196 [Venturia effusa]|uniref:Actin-like ATPase domain-containing protein n=1 Tax=Venturia effusa TaxID=50376 RepID=A0A517LJ38_9PEZI|nr:hypothetical protein FKW77_007196 [Venturia effusa]
MGSSNQWTPEWSQILEEPPLYRLEDSTQHSFATRYPLESTAISSDATSPHIVLAVDYGTTFSGIAWMHNDGETAITDRGVEVLDTWPRQTNPKVPSAISYDKIRSGQPSKAQWGYDIDNTSTVIRWTKSSLGRQKPLTELRALKSLAENLKLVNDLRVQRNLLGHTDKDIPPHLSKSAPDIVSDYLSELARCWHSHIVGLGQFTLEHVPLDIVITHPANWPYEAMNAIYRAVNATFGSRHLFAAFRNVSFSSEPESCALYTVREVLFRHTASIRTGECFIMCDAGGGTIDLVSFRVISREPLELEKVGVLLGDDFGSTLIDMEFLKWFDKKFPSLGLSPDDYHKNGLFVMDEKSNLIVQNFQKVKHSFTGAPDKDDYQITLPRFGVPGTGIAAELDQVFLRIPRGDLKKMFDVSVNRIIELVDDQYMLTTSCPGPMRLRNRVTNVFMAGGFSENEYLLDQVKQWAGSHPELRVHRAADCWSGVVKGAVLRGMGLGMKVGKSVQPCPKHFGISLSQPFRKHKHGLDSERHKTKNHFYDGEELVLNHITWLVRKGDLIPPDSAIKTSRRIHIDFNRHKKAENGTVRLLCVTTLLDEAPNIFDASQKSETFSIDIPLNELDTTCSTSLRAQRARQADHLQADADVVVKVSDDAIHSAPNEFKHGHACRRAVISTRYKTRSSLYGRIHL